MVAITHRSAVSPVWTAIRSASSTASREPARMGDGGDARDQEGESDHPAGLISATQLAEGEGPQDQQGNTHHRRW
jgi:hypothetical protein